MAKGLHPFKEAELQLLAESLDRTRQSVPVSVCAYGLILDHIHLILFPQEETTLDAMMRFEGVRFGRRGLTRSALRTRAQCDKTFDYINMNPVELC